MGNFITGVPNAASIGLYANLDEAFAALVADRLYPQYGRVRVGTDHGDRVSRLVHKNNC